MPNSKLYINFNTPGSHTDFTASSGGLTNGTVAVTRGCGWRSRGRLGPERVIADLRLRRQRHVLRNVVLLPEQRFGPVRLKLSGLEQRLGDDHERLGRARLLRLEYLFSGRQLEPRLYCKLTTGSSGQFLDGDADKWTDAASSFLYDQWVDLVVHVKWTASGSGIFDVYKNGARVYSLIGVRTLPSVAGTYQELMNYHAPTQNTIIEYAGGLAVGPSYASVDPATH